MASISEVCGDLESTVNEARNIAVIKKASVRHGASFGAAGVVQGTVHCGSPRRCVCASYKLIYYS